MIAYEAAEAHMANALDAELKLPQHVKDFNIDTFLKSLGYSIQKVGAADNVGRPPVGNTHTQPGGDHGRRMLQSGRRSRLVGMPPSRRRQ